MASTPSAFQLVGRVGGNSKINGTYVLQPEQESGERPVFYNAAAGLYMFFKPLSNAWVIATSLGGEVAPAVAISTAQHPLHIETPWQVVNHQRFEPDPNVCLQPCVYTPAPAMPQQGTNAAAPAGSERHSQTSYRLADVLNGLIRHERLLIDQLSTILDKFARDPSIRESLGEQRNRVLFRRIGELYDMHKTALDRLKEAGHMPHDSQVRVLRWLAGALNESSPTFVLFLPLLQHTAAAAHAPPPADSACPELARRERQLGFTLRSQLSAISETLRMYNTVINPGPISYQELPPWLSARFDDLDAAVQRAATEGQRNHELLSRFHCAQEDVRVSDNRRLVDYTQVMVETLALSKSAVRAIFGPRRKMFKPHDTVQAHLVLCSDALFLVDQESKCMSAPQPLSGCVISRCDFPATIAIQLHNMVYAVTFYSDIAENHWLQLFAKVAERDNNWIESLPNIPKSRKGARRAPPHEEPHTEQQREQALRVVDLAMLVNELVGGDVAGMDHHKLARLRKEISKTPSPAPLAYALLPDTLQANADACMAATGHETAARHESGSGNGSGGSRPEMGRGSRRSSSSSVASALLHISLATDGGHGSGSGRSKTNKIEDAFARIATLLAAPHIDPQLVRRGREKIVPLQKRKDELLRELEQVQEQLELVDDIVAQRPLLPRAKPRAEETGSGPSLSSASVSALYLPNSAVVGNDVPEAGPLSVGHTPPSPSHVYSDDDAEEEEEEEETDSPAAARRERRYSGAATSATVGNAHGVAHGHADTNPQQQSLDALGREGRPSSGEEIEQVPIKRVIDTYTRDGKPVPLDAVAQHPHAVGSPYITIDQHDEHHPETASGECVGVADVVSQCMSLDGRIKFDPGDVVDVWKTFNETWLVSLHDNLSEGKAFVAGRHLRMRTSTQRNGDKKPVLPPKPPSNAEKASTNVGDGVTGGPEAEGREQAVWSGHWQQTRGHGDSGGVGDGTRRAEGREKEEHGNQDYDEEDEEEDEYEDEEDEDFDDEDNRNTSERAARDASEAHAAPRQHKQSIPGAENGGGDGVLDPHDGTAADEGGEGLGHRRPMYRSISNMAHRLRFELSRRKKDGGGAAQ